MTFIPLKNRVFCPARHISSPVTVRTEQKRIGPFYVKMIFKRALKTIRLCVRRDGEIVLSVPLSCPVKTAEEFVLKKSDWLKKHLEMRRNVPSHEIVPGATLPVAGQNLTFLHTESHRKRIISDGAVVNVCCRVASFEKTAEEFIKQRLLLYVRQCAAAFSALTHLYPTDISVAKLRSKWGECNTSTGTIRFALMLAFRPEECIDYVVLHEIAHLKYRRHDRNFYGFIARFMPDYKARVKALNMS